MSKPKSPEALKAEAKKRLKAEMKRQMKMIKLVKETQNHDRKTCTCDGCHFYALMGTVVQSGRMFTVVQNWDGITPEEFLNSSRQFLQYKMDKQASAEKLMKQLEAKGIPKEQAKMMVEQALGPIHTVFYKVSPLGLMKEI